VRVLVTGGAGFLGSHICDHLLDRGDEVVAIDNLLTGRLDNIQHLFGRDGFTYVKHNVSQFVHVPGPVDAVMHFASPASPADFERIPIQILKVGSLGTHNLLGLAKDKGARFFLASTSEVYGDPEVHPQPETYWGHVNTIGIRGVYDEAKRFAEAMTMAYYRTHGVNSHIIRIFNTYGPRMRLDDGRVLPNFMGQALRGEPLTVYGQGSQTRSFCFVDDLVEGIYRLLSTDFHEPVNLGNPNEVTILEFAQEILKLSDSKSQIVYKPLPEDDPKVRRPDISRARQLLGWEPKVDRHEGLQRTMKYFRAKVAAAQEKPKTH